MSNDKIIPFPKKQQDTFFARCPNCSSFRWEIEVDAPDVKKILAFHCATPGCGLKIQLLTTVGAEDLSNLSENDDDVFAFSPDPSTELEGDFEFRLESDDDEPR